MSTVCSIWPLSTILSELRLTIPVGISQPTFSTSYDFEEVCLLNSVLLDVPHKGDDVYSFIQTLREREVYPIDELQKLTKSKVVFQGRLGYIELLFRGQIKRKKRVVGEWFNTDFGVPLPLRYTAPFKSDLFKMFGVSRSDFELAYYNETGLPFSFERELISRLEKTKSGSYYAVLIPKEKKDRVKSKTASQKGVVNEKYRFVVEDQKVEDSIISICKMFRVDESGPSNQISTPKSKYPSIPSSVRKQVWRVYNGNVGSAPCFVCNIEITALDYEAGHIQPRSLGGPNTVNNLLPICSVCNKSMSDTHLFKHVATHFSTLECRCLTLDSYKEWIRQST